MLGGFLTTKKAFIFAVIFMVAMAVWVVSHQPTIPPKAAPAAVKAVKAKPAIKAKPSPKPKNTKASRSKVRFAGNKFPVQTNTPSKRYAVGLVSATQWPCLHELWMRESGWSPTSDNPTSSAYGIPQILGLEARTGDDYKAQVRAGLSYIDHRYGTPCKAWSFWRSHRWY
jgi:hypothetical protein